MKQDASVHSSLLSRSAVLQWHMPLSEAHTASVPPTDNAMMPGSWAQILVGSGRLEHKFPQWGTRQWAVKTFEIFEVIRQQI